MTRPARSRPIDKNELASPYQSAPQLFCLASAAFALRFVALAAFSPYVFLWLESNGYDTHERGLLGALQSIMRFGSPFVLGSLADASGYRRTVFVVATASNAVAVAALTLCPASSAAQALLLCAAGLSDTGPLLDAFVMRSLAASGQATAAPRARAWGAATWCVAAPIFGAVAERSGLSLNRSAGPATLRLLC